jgi:polyhydroxybutyrate depolymerase
MDNMMKFRFLTILIFSIFSKGYSQVDVYDSIYHSGVWRTFNIHLPKGYNNSLKYPLVLGFHGGQQAATSSQGWTVFAYQSKLSEKADSSGFIVIYPEGLVLNQNRSWNAGNCCPPAINQNIDDVGFIDNLLDSVFSNYSIDTTRVYATGSSNGGMLCYRLACELSHRFAAIAPNACAQMYFPCNPTNKIPVISFHSKVDPIVPYTGGMGGASPLTKIYFPSQDSTMRLWSQKNNCSKRDTILNGNKINYDFVKIHDCSCNVEIHHYATTDGSHSWPGGNPNNNPVSTQINATNLLWEFFKKYTIPCSKVGASNIYNDNAILFPNPVFDFVNISNLKKGLNYTISDLSGKVIKNGITLGTIDLSNLSPAVYILNLNFGDSLKIYKIIKN